MNSIEKLNKYEFILHIKAKPNAKQQKIVTFTEKDNQISVMLKSKAIKNKANKELIKLLQKKLDLNSSQIEFLSGVKSQIKKLKLSFSRELSITELVNALNY